LTLLLPFIVQRVVFHTREIIVATSIDAPGAIWFPFLTASSVLCANHYRLCRRFYTFEASPTGHGVSALDGDVNS